jgi:hypothetical protein
VTSTPSAAGNAATGVALASGVRQTAPMWLAASPPGHWTSHDAAIASDDVPNGKCARIIRRIDQVDIRG